MTVTLIASRAQVAAERIIAKLNSWLAPNNAVGVGGSSRALANYNDTAWCVVY